MLRSITELVLLLTVLIVGGVVLEVPYVNEETFTVAEYSVNTVVEHIVAFI